MQALTKGTDGVFIGGCHLCDCHYVTHGNFNAFGMVQVCKKLLKCIGIYPERVRIEWVSAGEGIRFANFMNEYSEELTNLGPLGKAEGMDEKILKFRLQSVKKIIPYIRLVLTERIHVPEKTEEACYRFFSSAEFDRLFKELIADKLALSQIMSLLRERPVSSGEISEILGLRQSEVSRHLKISAKQGLAKYDVNSKCYAPA
jgi:hypothetical protein